MKLEITGIHYDVSSRLERYVQNKIGGLEKFIGKNERAAAVASVKLKESKAKNKNEYECYVLIALPGSTAEARESTTNMFAAVDIVEGKLKTQLKKRKDTHANPKFYQRLTNRLRRRS